MSDEPGGGGVVEIGDVNERLLWILRRAGDEWGPAGVARAAALLATPALGPRPLYVNHPRTEPTVGDIVRDRYGIAWQRHSEMGWNGTRGATSSTNDLRSAGPLTLLWDGETGQVIPQEDAADDTDLTAEEVGALIDSGAPAEQVVPYRPARCWEFEDGLDGFVVHAECCPYVGRSWMSGSRCIDYAPWGDRSWPAWVTR
jgi:hypothetical protein